jgi:5'-3' exonuclease
VTHTVLLDTSSLMYRAFFSTPPTVRDAQGRPVNALHGYLDMTARLIGSRHPDRCVHVYDHDWRPAPRVAIYAGYKANRQPDPEGLPEQFDVLRTVLDALGLPQAESPGWEAEDAIGTLCARQPADVRTDIVTGDRDLLQLVRDPAVRVLFTLRGVSDLHVFDEAGVLEKYGVPASRYAEFAILRGDPSDGLPGVRGVGEKTARLLVQTYPSLAALLVDARAPRRTGPPLQRSATLRAAVGDAADYLDAMQRIVPIRTDLEVREWSEPADPARLEELTERHALTGPVRRLAAVLAGNRSATRSSG